MGEYSSGLREDESSVVLNPNPEDNVYDDPFNQLRPGQLVLWEIIKLTPVPEGPIVSEK